MLAGARPRKGARHADNVPVGRLELVGQVDLVAGRVLEELDGGDLVADLDPGAGRRVEAPGHAGGGTGDGDASEGCAEGHCVSVEGRGRARRRR
ncbi:hypothetical protein VFPBJ_10468 [Purpureocillium lilacinum]|uniref:Uncharacterized protein n=1 Tax=Purpureocillium lilacinum TaxID=33203 RepID=A0A179G3E9_PURLI|nr:hypothetical protein VFPBJ_10468 [Purpureocillium lilacinum]